MSFIKKWLRADIQDIEAYQVPEEKYKIKLDAMEAPFPVPDKLIKQYLESLADAQVNRYPSPSAKDLQQTLRRLMNISDEFEILLGNGSDELIQLLGLACSPNDTVLSFEPSFVMYEMISKITHLNHKRVSLDNDFEIDLECTKRAIKKHNPKLIFIAYPNNPTGNSFKRSSIEGIIKATNALVVLDEAYYAYADDSFLNDIKKYSNLVVLRTVSKIGFAGLRLGLLIGSKDTLLQLNKLRLPYNINALTQASSNFLLKQQDEVDKNAEQIIKQRERLSNELRNIKQLKIYPSRANFILFKAQRANELFENLKDNGVLIKSLTNVPKLDNCLRVTVGNKSENKVFLQKLKNFYI